MLMRYNNYHKYRKNAEGVIKCIIMGKRYLCGFFISSMMGIMSLNISTLSKWCHWFLCLPDKRKKELLYFLLSNTYCIIFPILNIGRYMAISTTPTNTPSKRIITGSINLLIWEVWYSNSFVYLSARSLKNSSN